MCDAGSPHSTHVGPRHVSLAWPSCADLTKSVTYSIAVDGVVVAETAGASYVLTRLVPGRDYDIAVSARDVAGNATGVGEEISVRTRPSWAVLPPAVSGAAILENP